MNIKLTSYVLMIVIAANVVMANEYIDKIAFLCSSKDYVTAIQLLPDVEKSLSNNYWKNNRRFTK